MRKPNGFAVVCLSAFLVCGVGGYSAFRFGGAGDRKQLAVQIARGERLGLPKSEPDYREVAEARNAAPLYQELAKRKSTLASTLFNLGLQKAAWRIGSGGILKPIQKDLALFESAASLSDFRPIPGQARSDLIAEEFQAIRSAAFILRLRAQAEATQGSPIGSLRTLQPLFRASKQFARSLGIEEYQLACDLAAQAMRGMEKAVAAGGSDPKFRAAAQKVLRDMDPLPNPKLAMRGQWLRLRSFLEQFDHGEIRYEDYPQSQRMFGTSRDYRLLQAVPALRARQELEMVRIFVDCYEGMPEDPRRIHLAVEATKRASIQLAAGGFDRMIAWNFCNLPSAHSAGVLLAQRRILSALLKALDETKTPKDLPVTGEDAIDPFSGGELGYHATPNEIRIWSVGVDQVDGKGSSAGDIVAVWPPEKSRP